MARIGITVINSGERMSCRYENKMQAILPCYQTQTDEEQRSRSNMQALLWKQRLAVSTTKTSGRSVESSDVGLPEVG
jgi:hypothetical protein